jgi:acyl-coenzyme A thioesterase PaaI-like protein
MNAPADPAFAQRCRESFGRQKAMALIGARLTVVDPGYVEIELPWRAELTARRCTLTTVSTSPTCCRP